MVEETCYSQECLVKVGSQESLVDCLIILGVDLGDCVVDSVEILEVDSAVILVEDWVEILEEILEVDSVFLEADLVVDSETNWVNLEVDLVVDSEVNLVADLEVDSKVNLVED